MTELEVESRFPGSFVQFLPSSTPCFSFCNVSGIELHLGLLHFIQSLLVTEISEKKTRIGSFWHFFLECLCYICYLWVKSNDSFYWIFSFPLSAEWFYLAQCKRYVLILPALFRLRGGRGFCVRNIISLGPNILCAVATLPDRDEWHRCHTALLWSRHFQGSKCSTEPCSVLSPPLPPVQLCPGAALYCWSGTEGLQAFSWSYRCRNCLPRSEASNSNGTEVHLNKSHGQMSVMTERASEGNITLVLQCAFPGSWKGSI